MSIDATERGRWRLAHAAWIAIAVALAVAPGVVSFDPVGLAWDAAEYVWMLRADMLPHSPYLGYLAIGELASLALEPALALAAVSAAAYLASAVVLGLLASALGAGRLRAITTVVTFLALPIAMRQSGTQEIYALQTFFLMLAIHLLCRDGDAATTAGGAAYGVALTVHSASLLVAPAVLYLLWSDARRSRTKTTRWRATLLFVAPQVLLGLVVVACLCWAFRGSEQPLNETFLYLRGIAPLPSAISMGQFAKGLALTARTLFYPEVVGWPAAIAVVTAAGLLR